ncbi:MAG: apolipoprotein N-acyltransferase [Planctomycetaceae bacterium]|nr:apolipoprotein N-acyltransferase [Planctomycetaceae bacterium]
MTALAAPVRPSASSRMPRETTPHEIIASARAAPAGMKGALLVSGLTALLMWAAFTPVNFGPLAWVCLAPLLTLVRLEKSTARMYRAVFLGGMAFWLATLQWMRLGDNLMYISLVALSCYLALYFPAFLALTRVAVWRFGVPLTLAAPTIWVGLELLRGRLANGFSWYFLGHTQYQWIELIQISDLVGAYGVSFLPALVAACIVELLPATLLVRLRLVPAFGDGAPLPRISFAGQLARVAFCLTLFAATLGYGYWRRGTAEFQPGPRVGLVQSNVTSKVKHDRADWPKIQRSLENLTGQAVKQQPDLIVWPETMFRWPLLETPLDVSDADLEAAHPGLNLSWLRDLQVRRKLSQMSQMAGTAMIIGLETVNIDRSKIHTYNSAAYVRADGFIAGRYDKLHRVPFGEFVPLGDQFPWLRQLLPFVPNIDAGIAPAVFELHGYRFSPIICFEDTVPHLVRNIVNSTTEPQPDQPKRIDFLVNLTNDGWFHGSSELDQHLITAAFRSVECRTPMVRAVNTGISAFIDGDGVIRRRAPEKQQEAVVVDNIPLDTRQSFYLVGGDWFAGGCLICCGFLAVMGLLGRWLPARTSVRPV